jgi:hypothetical protein
MASPLQTTNLPIACDSNCKFNDPTVYTSDVARRSIEAGCRRITCTQKIHIAPDALDVISDINVEQNCTIEHRIDKDAGVDAVVTGDDNEDDKEVEEGDPLNIFPETPLDKAKKWVSDNTEMALAIFLVVIILYTQLGGSSPRRMMPPMRPMMRGPMRRF